MITKTAFFALLNDKESRINSTAHVAVFEEGNGKTSLIIRQHSAPNAFLSTHKASTTTNAAFAKYNAWLNEWFVARAEEVQATIEADRKAGRPVDEEGNDTREWCGNDIKAAHAEALEINAVIDEAIRRAACFSDLDSATSNAINHAIDYVRNSLLNLNRYNARFIVKMMVSVRRLAKLSRAKAAENHRAMLAHCAASGEGCNEIPF